jgi:pyruvate kinase
VYKKIIIATLGPSSLKKEIVQKIDKLGVDIFRLNLSHVNLDELEETLKMVKLWTKKTVCTDSEGAQLRTGNLNGKILSLIKGTTISILGCEAKEIEASIKLNIKKPEELLSVGDLLRIDFNSVVAQLTKVESSNVFARIIKGGKIGSNKGIGIDRPVTLPRFSEKDLAAFKISKKLGIDTIFLSFCSKGEDVLELRKLFDYPIKVISKVESNIALINLSSICEESDAILIDRGDLSRDVPLAKIAYAQSFILKTATNLKVPAYVATNLVESMIDNSEPTRAEIHDIVNTLESGASGLVLAAETAIGKHPVECVRVISNLLQVVDKKPTRIDIEYLSSPSSENIILPHGGHLVEQFITKESEYELSKLPILEVNEKIESDITQIANGTYSPLDRFMDYDELLSVLNRNMLRNDIIWTLPIVLQVKNNQIVNINNKDDIAIRSEKTGSIFAILKLGIVEEIKNKNQIVLDWFGTNDLNHPGANSFLNGGDFILSGRPFLLNTYKTTQSPSYDLTPTQTRNIFSLNNWIDIIGYHTRNIPHKGHEYIQKKSLEETNADGIFISPVTGIKKRNDFTSEVIISCYENLIQSGFYDSAGVLLGSFNTYSRYSGPREAVFTAICRKNFGCNHFIVGRDHTGCGDYYPSDAAQNIFKELDIGMKILTFGEVGYCTNKKMITDNHSINKLEISGSLIRHLIFNNEDIPSYLLNPVITKEIKQILKDEKTYSSLFVK